VYVVSLIHLGYKVRIAPRGRRKVKRKSQERAYSNAVQAESHPSPRFILTSFHPYSLSISRAGIDCARNASFTSSPLTEMPRSSKYRIMTRLPFWIATQKPGARSLIGGSRASINSASGAVSVESHRRQSAESCSGSKRSRCGGVMVWLTVVVESQDIIDCDLRDVNDAGTIKDLCGHIQYLQ
jgi:hypothetical protein